MATLNTALPTLLDLTSRMDPNGSMAKIVETLSRKNPLLEDMSWVQGNLPTGHRFTSRTALPSVAWRRLNEGVAPSKSRTAQTDETCGQMAGMSKVDVDEAKLSGNAAAFRASEDGGFVQSFNQELETGLFYHSTKTSPEKIHGLSSRLDATTALAGSQILKADATASGNDQSSIWLIVWGPETVFGIVPKDLPGGLQHTDLGVQLTRDANNNEFEAYVTSWKWNVGLGVKDYRYLVRIANVDTGNLSATGTTVIDAMSSAIDMVQDLTSGRPAFYANRRISTFLRQQVTNQVKQSTLTIEDVGGRPVTKFLGIPVRRTDSLLNTEAAVS